MERPGFLLLTLRAGEAPTTVPAHLDSVLGAARPANTLDGGPVDRALERWGGGFRALGVYHARASLGRAGEQGAGFDDVEESLGLSRTYRIQLADRERTAEAVAALREVARVESVAFQTLATTPFVAAPAAGGRLTRAEAWEPHERVHAPESLAEEPGDERVTVAVVDTGIALGHPEFQRKLLAGYDTVDIGIGGQFGSVRLLGDSRGQDFCPRDGTGHGSHVAGVLGAQGWRLPRGVAGRALILPIRALAAAMEETRRKVIGVGGLPDIDEAMKVAVDLGADVINMSFGTAAADADPLAPPPHSRVIRYATHYGCVLVAASGNSGARERFYPAALPEVIAVGSVDRAGRRSAFSTYGPHVALCAPGERIASVSLRGYLVSTGTSHAAPFVAGAAALLLGRARRRNHRLTGAEVRQVLIESAAPLGGGDSEETGHGLLDVRAALRRLDRGLAGDGPAWRRR